MEPWPALAPYARSLRLRTGLEVFLFQAGPADAPAVLAIHGLGDEADTWRHVFPALTARFRVAALDLPGFGRSDKPRRTYTLDFLRDTVLEVWDLLGWPSVTLLGHSLGAVIAQRAALARPDQVEALWLVGGSLTTRAARLSPILVQMALPVLGRRLYNGLRRDPQAAYQSLQGFYHRLDDLPEPDRRFLFERVNERVWSDGQRDAFLSILRHLVWSAPGQQGRLEAQLAQLATPTRAIWGELDAVNSVESGKALAELQASATLTVLPGCGHAPHQEAPQAFLQALLA